MNPAPDHKLREETRMKRTLQLAFVALLTFALPATALAQGQGQAQDHAASAETLDQIAMEHTAAEDAKRAELRAFLERPEVRKVADQSGIDIRTAENAVATLSPEEIDSLSGELAAAQTALAGGDTVVISTTAIIIGLLVLILLLVAD